MKVGLRKPSLNKSISARTKGNLTRKIKKKFPTYYGTKDTGWLYPEKKAYNAIYKRTTFSVMDIVKWILKKIDSEKAKEKLLLFFCNSSIFDLLNYQSFSKTNIIDYGIID